MDKWCYDNEFSNWDRESELKAEKCMYDKEDTLRDNIKYLIKIVNELSNRITTLEEKLK